MGAGAVRGFAGAVAFLTRVPAGSGAAERALPAAVPWFPVVGALVGAAVAASFAAATAAFPPLVAGFLAVGVGIAVTGALHEDGLGDTADAFGGGGDRDSTLGILRDPRLGTYGVVAIALGVLIRGASISSLDAWEALAALVGAHALSRAAAVGVLAVVPPAAADGLGAAYGRRVGGVRGAAGMAIGLALGAGALGVIGVGAAVPVAAASLGIAWVSRRRIGGVTGDVLGAVQQVGEVLVLLVAVGAARAGWELAWWR